MYWGSIFHALQILVNFYNVIRPGLMMQKKQLTVLEPNEQRLGAVVHLTAGQNEFIVRDSHNTTNSNNNTKKAKNNDEDLDEKNMGLKEVMISEESAGVVPVTQKMNNYLSLNNLVFHHHDKKSSHRGSNAIKNVL